MTKPKLEQVRAFVMRYKENGQLMIDDMFLTQRECLEVISVNMTPDAWECVQVEIRPVLPTPPPELSGNTGELKQPKETPSDEEEWEPKFHKWQCRIEELESQLEDYRKALEWLFSDDTILRKDIFESRGDSALEALQWAMAKEGESR